VKHAGHQAGEFIAELLIHEETFNIWRCEGLGKFEGVSSALRLPIRFSELPSLRTLAVFFEKQPRPIRWQSVEQGGPRPLTV
jgi:hypothetical protein